MPRRCAAAASATTVTVALWAGQGPCLQVARSGLAPCRAGQGALQEAPNLLQPAVSMQPGDSDRVCPLKSLPKLCLVYSASPLAQAQSRQAGTRMMAARPPTRQRGPPGQPPLTCRRGVHPPLLAPSQWVLLHAGGEPGQAASPASGSSDCLAVATAADEAGFGAATGAASATASATAALCY